VTVDEWDQRQVCPDGGCVGVIGADGLCKVCGRAATNWGDERKRGLVAEASSDDETDGDESGEEGGDGDEESAEGSEGSSSDADYEWSRRKLCPDEACIGVVGSNGKCNVCGRSAA
jgi:hypothetical protein